MFPPLHGVVVVPGLAAAAVAPLYSAYLPDCLNCVGWFNCRRRVCLSASEQSVCVCLAPLKPWTHLVKSRHC